MFKSTLCRYVAAALVGAALTFGAVSATRGQEPHQLTWVVIDQHTYPDGTLSCRTEFAPHIAKDLAQYDVGPGADDGPNNICVTRMDLTVSGIEQLPESLGDDLVGLFPATDSTGKPIEFSVYLPVISTR